MICFGNVPAGSVLPVVFNTYNSTGASVTLTGLAVTDVEIYKGTSITQRSSDAGYTLIDTDGIDIDGTTGIHGFSIDTGDNTDSGFYSVGSYFTVVVSAVTVDSQTVNFVAATFRLIAAEHTAGYPVATIKDGTGTGEIDTSSGGVLVSSIAANAITATAINADAFTAAKFAADVTTELQSGLATAAAVATLQTSVDDIPTNAELATSQAAADDATLAAIAALNNLSAAQVNAEVDTAIADAALATAANLATVAGYIDTEIATIITAVDALPTNAELATALGTADDAVLAAIAALNNLSAAAVNAEVDTAIADAALATAANLATLDGKADDIKAKTDSLTFTVAGEIDANIQSVNDVTVTGTGAVGDEWGP
jgi:hypothetical protein